ncbi:MAG TPA: M1 family aminopeptidase [Terriglobales bacterium]|nr:M1 family aminopeptidase [Terriglobales bacterium]
MKQARRLRGRAGKLLFVLAFGLLLALSAGAAERPRIQVDDYQIDAEILPVGHRLTARAKVKLTALEDINTAVLELHNDLRPTKITGPDGKPLQFERVTEDSTVRVFLPAGLSKGQSTTLTFDYEGVLQSADDSPVEGLKLAYVGPDTTYLLYAGRWFPMTGYLTDRFTATINFTVPTGMTVIGSGKPTTKSPGPGRTTYSFTWDRPSFPGTIIAGNFVTTTVNSGGVDAHVYFKPEHQAELAPYADTAVKEFEFYSALYGPAPARNLSVVELPDDTVPAAWAPEVAAIASRAVAQKTNYRLLANTIAHQWWGVLVAPATRDDDWLSDGFARYSEARYVLFAAGRAGFEEASKDMAVGALAYNNIPLASAGKLDPWSPEFQSLVTDKGAMLLHMLQWVVGDQAFDKATRAYAQQFAGKTVTVDDFQKAVETAYGDHLTWFFAEWLNSTGAPEFRNKYAIYRLGSNKGFRITGEISQDMDLFRMPVELKIDTDGPPVSKRIEVVGTNSPYVVDTFTKPRRIYIDPNSNLLRNSPTLRIRVDILRGQQLVEQGDLSAALKEFQKALELNPNSSLAHYRIAEVFFVQHNYQAAADEYREAYNGDGEPNWTIVWGHIQLGKIFDLTDQRERAVNEYRQALQTNDNTQNALEEARKYLSTPYRGAKPTEGN